MSIVKEFYKIDKNKPTIGLLLMLKNEEKRIEITLNSILGYMDAIIVYDTGSTDRTIDIVSQFAETHKINLYLEKGEFVDFSTSRNISLDIADKIDVHYILMLDCNDELKNGKRLREYCSEFLAKPTEAFLVCQQWYTGKIDSYYNTRLIKARKGWRYRGAVHEWLRDTKAKKDEEPIYPVFRLDDDVILYQDRTKDDDKSQKRFSRDRELLLREHQKDQKEPRTLFYLAQTCECLGLIDEAFYYSKIRLELQGFFEERFHSFMRCAKCALLLGHEWHTVMPYYLKCYEEQLRAEPLVRIAEYYKLLADNAIKEGKNAYHYWRSAFIYINEACEIPFPEHCILFMERSIYDYDRWHLMGIIGFYAGKMEHGKNGCLKAIESGGKEVDKNNLKLYIEAENKILIKPDNNITKNKFIEEAIKKLREKFPKAKEKELIGKAKLLWKTKN